MKKIIIDPPEEKMENIRLEDIPSYGNYIFAVGDGRVYTLVYTRVGFFAVSFEGELWDDEAYETSQDLIRELERFLYTDFEFYFLENRKEVAELVNKYYG